MIMRSIEDVTASDWTVPMTNFVLKTPDEGATVVADADVIPTWAATSDLDGNTVGYEWVLYGPDSTEIVAVTSNEEGAATTVTLPASVVDGLLVAAGVVDGLAQIYFGMFGSMMV